MILESTQLLNNALIKNDPEYLPVYRKTHVNHPCSIWTSRNSGNFKWLLDLALHLCDEYTFRYGKIHKCQGYLEQFKNADLSGFEFQTEEPEEFAQCMPVQYRGADAVTAYRTYYLNDKGHIASWKKRGEPDWWKQGKEDEE